MWSKVPAYLNLLLWGSAFFVSPVSFADARPGFGASLQCLQDESAQVMKFRKIPAYMEGCWLNDGVLIVSNPKGSDRAKTYVINGSSVMTGGAFKKDSKCFTVNSKELNGEADPEGISPAQASECRAHAASDATRSDPYGAYWALIHAESDMLHDMDLAFQQGSSDFSNGYIFQGPTHESFAGLAQKCVDALRSDFAPDDNSRKQAIAALQKQVDELNPKWTLAEGSAATQASLVKKNAEVTPYDQMSTFQKVKYVLWGNGLSDAFNHKGAFASGGN